MAGDRCGKTESGGEQGAATEHRAGSVGLRRGVRAWNLQAGDALRTRREPRVESIEDRLPR